MRIAIVHNAVEDTSAADEKDVLVQAETVSEALKNLGNETICIPCSLDLLSVRRQLEDIKPHAVFNLVESLQGQDRLIYLFPAVLDAMGIPYTGSPTEAIFLTTHKVLAKERMTIAGIQTPPWLGPYPATVDILNTICQISKKNKWIVKSLWDHASIGLDERNLMDCDDAADLIQSMKSLASQLGGACFAETYIDGREFNLSLLAENERIDVLPPAEIIFEGYEEGKPKIVGYRAKWQEDTYEYHHTPRSFDFPKEEDSLLENLKQIAVRCWKTFGLRGYARVDFRVDTSGNPYVLEINANPCLSPDAGFAAALERKGLTFEEAVNRILSSVFAK